MKEVRGKGLLIAVEMDSPCMEMVNYCMDKGFLINCIQEKILRFIPPLIVQKEEIDSLINILEKCFEEKLNKHS